MLDKIFVVRIVVLAGNMVHYCMSNDTTISHDLDYGNLVLIPHVSGPCKIPDIEDNAEDIDDVEISEEE